MAVCELLETCSFYRHFGQRKSNVWKGLVGFYCRSSGLERCERRRVFFSRGVFPDDDIMPTGEEIPKVFLALD